MESSTNASNLKHLKVQHKRATRYLGKISTYLMIGNKIFSVHTGLVITKHLTHPDINMYQNISVHAPQNDVDASLIPNESE